MSSAIAAIRLLVFTGARVSEILTLKWAYIDQEEKRLLLPDSKTGAKIIFLNEPACEILVRIVPIQGNPYVIAGGVADSHLKDLEKPWQRIRAEAGICDVRLHDLRHSFASMAVSSGQSLPMIGGLLGHRNTSTTARYAHLAARPMHRANKMIGRHLLAAMLKPPRKPVEPAQPTQPIFNNLIAIQVR
jgi:integrase